MIRTCCELSYEEAYEAGAEAQNIARTIQLAEALGVEYHGQSWESLICLVDKACSLLVNRETAERIGREVKADFQEALRETNEMWQRMDEAHALRTKRRR